MVWKQDLAKLKQAFREAGGPPPPPVKPKPKPLEVKDLNDEDAMFLAAMGGPAPRPKPAPEVLPARPAPELAQAADISFEAGLAELKGLRPMGKPVAMPAPPEPPPPAEPALSRPLPAPALAEAETPVAAPETPEALTRGPLRIQLAAGMAIEVDASLDLRNHSVPDALGRLRDRIEDGAHMGWRTLHVVLGEDAALREAMMGFLSEGPAPRIGRYAQAPIPMGGAQAWVLYY